jgi:methylmalonyl-CoA/ethylmalonyl-CoA epimerase
VDSGDVPLGKVDHVGYVVDDLDGARAFLTGVLGFAVDREVSVPGRVRAVVLSQGGNSIELMDIAEARATGVPPESLPRDHVALEVENLDEAVAQLRAAGVETTRPEASSSGSTRSYFTKPETSYGIAYQLFERQPASD